VADDRPGCGDLICADRQVDHGALLVVPLSICEATIRYGALLLRIIQGRWALVR